MIETDFIIHQKSEPVLQRLNGEKKILTANYVLNVTQTIVLN